MGQEGPDKKGKGALGSNNDYFSKLASLELFLIQVCVFKDLADSARHLPMRKIISPKGNMP